MKTRHSMIALAACVLMFTGCADKFLTAKIAVNAGRAGLNMAQIGVDTATKSKQQACKVSICKKLGEPGTVKYQACMGQDHSTDPGWVACYAKLKRFNDVTWPQITKTANAGFDTADKSIQLAEAQKAGLPIDVMPVLKSSACLVAQSLEFLPEKYRKEVQMFLDMMKAFGCTK